jgi:nitroreductase
MDIYEAIHQRRSHRLYKTEMPPREALERVIEAGLWAPSGTNLQDWEITIMAGKVRDDFVDLVSQAIKNLDRKSTRLNSSHRLTSRMPSSA